MATDDDGQQNPFTRPGFIAAAVVIVVVVVLGIVLAIVNGTRDDEPGALPSSSPAGPSAAPTADTTEIPGGASVCGLGGEVLSGTLTTAPVAEWQYHGTASYPFSAEVGPAETDPAGFRYCFQHTPEGALFAATYAATVGTDPTVVSEWVKYFAAPGIYRDQLIEEAGSAGESADIRLRVAGFRLLAYDGSTANVDVAMVASVQGQTVNMSAVYPLVWSDGDWKLSTDTPEPGNVASIPDLTGYTPWGQ